MNPHVRESGKAVARAVAAVAVIPALCSFYVRGAILGRDRALEGSSQAFGLLPGLLGQYVRRAFLSRVLARCAPSATIECGVFFSSTGARIDDRVYVGPNCHLGLIHLEHDVLLAPAVHVPSGRLTHGIANVRASIRDQPGERQLVRIGAGSWIGSASVVMADVGSNTIVGAGAVVTRPLPDDVMAAGVPARVVRHRDDTDSNGVPRT